MRLLTKVWNLFERFRCYRTQWIEDLPETPERNTIYVVGGREYPYYAVVVCPRRKCRKAIHLEISPEFKRRWKFRENRNGTLSLSPSIHVTDSSCRCHYWIKNGKVVWAAFPSILVPAENRKP